MPPALIYGTGKTALVLADYVRRQYDIAGFVVAEQYMSSEEFLGLPVFAFEAIEKKLNPSEYSFFVAVGDHRMNVNRANIIEDLGSRGYSLPAFIDNRAAVAADVSVGSASVILDNVALQPGAQIGSGSFIWSNSVVAHGASVGDNCWITSGVVIAGDSEISSNCFLGINSSIGHNVRLGTKTFVGAGSIITKHTPENSVYVTPDAQLGRMDSTRFLELVKI